MKNRTGLGWGSAAGFWAITISVVALTMYFESRAKRPDTQVEGYTQAKLHEMVSEIDSNVRALVRREISTDTIQFVGVNPNNNIEVAMNGMGELFEAMGFTVIPSTLHLDLGKYIKPDGEVFTEYFMADIIPTTTRNTIIYVVDAELDGMRLGLTLGNASVAIPNSYPIMHEFIHCLGEMHCDDTRCMMYHRSPDTDSTWKLCPIHYKAVGFKLNTLVPEGAAKLDVLFKLTGDWGTTSIGI